MVKKGNGLDLGVEPPRIIFCCVPCLRSITCPKWVHLNGSKFQLLFQLQAECYLWVVFLIFDRRFLFTLLFLSHRYLIPCTHILSSQKRTIKELDIYSKSASKFLSLIPIPCSSCSQSSSPSSSNENLNSSSNTPMKIDLKTSSELVFYGSTQLEGLYSEVNTDYMEYLTDARCFLRDCQMRCSCWSAPYDGQNPSPQDPPMERERSASNLSTLSAPVANGDIPNKGSSLKASDDLQIPIKRSKSTNDSETKKQQVDPDLGPFLSTLFQKLERMPQNSFYVNLILTGVVSRLALYPQPLLRSFLLNYNMVLKPGVRSLFQVRLHLCHL